MTTWRKITREEEGEEVLTCPECGGDYIPDYEEGVTETCYSCYGKWMAEINAKMEED